MQGNILGLWPGDVHLKIIEYGKDWLLKYPYSSGDISTTDYMEGDL